MLGVISNSVHQEPVEEKNHSKALEFSLTTFHLTLQTPIQGEKNHPNVI